MTVVLARPAAEGSSNKHVVVAVALSSTPADNALRNVLTLHDKLRDRYPRRQEFRAATVPVNPAAQVVGPANPEALTGFSFDFVKPDGTIQQAIICNGNLVRIGRIDCRDQDQFQRVAVSELSLIAPALNETVQNISVERLDRFVWGGAYDDFDPAHVLRRECEWLTPNLFDAKDLWHTNHGLFEYLNDPHDHRLLHVIEVSAILGDGATPKEPEATIVVDIKQAMTVVHGKLAPTEDPDPVSAERLLGESGHGGLLQDYVPAMFLRGDKTLERVLNDDMCSAISLNTQ